MADSEIMSPVIMGYRHDNTSEVLAAFVRLTEEAATLSGTIAP